MPLRSPRPCLKPGCGRLVPAVAGRASYCEAHRPKDERIGSYAQRSGVDRQSWDDARKDFLRRNPLCRAHLNRLPRMFVRAVVVDHITPHRGDMDLFWDESNWQPLCHPCHARKTVKEDGGFGR